MKTASTSMFPVAAAAMDVARPARRGSRRRRLVAASVAGLAALGGITVALGRMVPALPSFDRASVWTGVVKRGAMVRAVRGGGVLVSEEVRWVTAPSAGSVERIALLPGVPVRRETVLVELRNPEIEQAAVDAASQLRVAEARRAGLALQLESESLTHESNVAALRSDLTLARIEAEADEALEARGQQAGLTARRTAAKASELKERVALEERRSGLAARAGRAQLAALDAEIGVLRAQERLARERLAALAVRAGQGGVLERLGDEQPLRPGQQLAPGASVARVASVDKLKAEIHVPEAEAKDLTAGLRAAVDVRGDTVEGRVTRVDPAVRNGTVTVDVALASLPKTARPGVSVDVTITIERLDDVLHVGRPVGVAAGARAGVWRLTDGGAQAVRVRVGFGRASVDSIEVAEGLRAGDEIVLSDATAWDAHDRVALKGRTP